MLYNTSITSSLSNHIVQPHQVQGYNKTTAAKRQSKQCNKSQLNTVKSINFVGIKFCGLATVDLFEHT